MGDAMDVDNPRNPSFDMVNHANNASANASANTSKDKFTRYEESDATSDSDDSESWISNFCSQPGYDYFATVYEDFIEDDFNLTGLGALVPYYKDSMELILDIEPEEPTNLPNMNNIEQSAELLYGLIHARFIVTRQGLEFMARKYECKHFGVCPRTFCEGTSLLPTGRHDLPGYESVRLYCPCCGDLYVPPNSRYHHIDGAFFGTSFVGLFLQMFPDVLKECEPRRGKSFQLTLFGFKINEKSKAGPRMKWLRDVPANQEELEVDDPKDDANLTKLNDNSDNNSAMSISVHK
ncbi:hypothetical protein NADFUDRAFT_46874 [Nadsonia fulvescens var. elongata DSM 6958]|uniref:Casein kinase II subunit beta n=1 Tax=Nadsonia fulvescens var. elongata DSM 6958 TaxID=857566 RepID=A0A1E3PI77_9ASCO|nr:hypothetical protein NADFUDRAFT_46874 [Nadsonia fulvescens var. elongata DSM 6958]